MIQVQKLASKDIFQTMSLGRKLQGNALLFYWKPELISGFNWQVIVSKKKIPLAVDRHKIKRRVRAAFAVAAISSFPRGSLVVIPHKQVLTAKLSQLIRDWLFFWQLTKG